MVRIIVVRLRPIRLWYKLACAAAILFIVLLFLIPAMMADKNDIAKHYRYDKRVSSNGVELHTIETTPDHVGLQAIDTNVTATPFYGVNGGFFWEGALLSVAVVNGRPLKGEPGDYGSGWYNTGITNHLPRGTLVWDGSDRRFSVQIVTSADELAVRDKQQYWAQGGVSMSLGNEAVWRQEMIAQEMPGYDNGHMRTGLVYDSANRLYMIVSPTSCTVEQFRSAIVEQLGDRKLVDGIFLDGDGSSQLQTKQVRLAGDRRQVFQMLAVTK
ncbi:phosphodiester glycosidase family protein [Paenibacillus sp. y28]|uniref:phosphodiester glycosidase family protein n=1 Tax=Paenibacillus sp. y28 TaxID=3129110 RepID=UPI0030169399